MVFWDPKSVRVHSFDALWFRQQGRNSQISYWNKRVRIGGRTFSRDYVSQCSEPIDVQASISGRFVWFASSSPVSKWSTVPCLAQMAIALFF